nr:putative ribonuclease H-like domain-containing protein [Ipomoea batatas]
MNVDGSHSMARGAAGCGVVLRDANGGWIEGFTYNIGHCSIGEAEAWGVLQGLLMASRHGISNLIVESDSKPGQHNSVLNRCIAAVGSFCQVLSTHAYREQNRIADAMAKRALLGSSGLMLWSNLPGGLSEMLHEDNIGAKFIRRTPTTGVC